MGVPSKLSMRIQQLHAIAAKPESTQATQNIADTSQPDHKNTKGLTMCADSGWKDRKSRKRQASWMLLAGFGRSACTRSGNLKPSRMKNTCAHDMPVPAQLCKIPYCRGFEHQSTWNTEILGAKTKRRLSVSLLYAARWREHNPDTPELVLLYEEFCRGSRCQC